MKRPAPPIIIFISMIVLLVMFRGGRDFWCVAAAGVLAAVNLFLIIKEALLQKKRLPVPPLSLLAGIFIGLVIFISLYRDVFPISLRFIIKLCIYYTVFVGSFLYFDKSPDIKTFLVLLTCAAAAFSFFGLVTYLYKVYTCGYSSAALTAGFVNKNHFAGFLELTIPCAAALFYFPLSKSQKTSLLYPLIMMAVAMGFTMSRGGWISLSCGIIIYLFMLLPFSTVQGKKLSILIFCGAVVLAVITFYAIGVTPLVKRYERTIDSKYMGMQGRLMMWESSFEAIKKHPWIGSGPGTFPYKYQQYRPRGILKRVTFAHSDYIQALFETGLIGLFLIILLIERSYNGFAGAYMFYIKKLRKSEFEERFTEQHCTIRFGLLLSLICALTAISVHSFVDFNMHLAANGVLFATIMGIGMRTVYNLPDEEKE